jgi:hypothetical protein
MGLTHTDEKDIGQRIHLTTCNICLNPRQRLGLQICLTLHSVQFTFCVSVITLKVKIRKPAI